MPMTPLPTPPSPTDDVATFNARAAAHVAAQVLFVTEANALEAAVDADATAAAADRALAQTARTGAETARDTAITNANNAAASAGATAWVSGTTYALGARVWSPINQRLYARSVAGGGTTDPSLDAANWSPIWPLPKLVSARSFYL